MYPNNGTETLSCLGQELQNRTVNSVAIQLADLENLVELQESRHSKTISIGTTVNARPPYRVSNLDGLRLCF
jgi:hypothetical protein